MFNFQQFCCVLVCLPGYESKNSIICKKHIADFQCAMFEATSTLQINLRIKNGCYLCSMMKIFYLQLQDIQILPRSREVQRYKRGHCVCRFPELEFI